MAGLFDPSMFPNAMASGAPAMGLLARLAGLGMINQPTQLAPGFPQQQPQQQQPGMDAMASGILPPQGPAQTQSAPPMSPQPPGLSMGQQNNGTLSAAFGNPDGGGFLNGLHGFLQQHQNALAGLGAGIASGGLQRGVGGMAQGGQMDYQRNLQQGSLAAMFHALKSAGASDAEATMGAMSPEGFKAISAKYLDPQLTPTEIGTDPVTGQKIMGTFNKRTGQFTDTAGKPVGANGSLGTNTALSGSDYMDTLRQQNPGFASRVQGVLDGREAPPPGGSRAPQAQALLNAAAQAEPGFDFTKWTTRNQTAKDFASGGKSGQMLKSAEQGLGHTQELMQSIDKLPDTGSPVLNSIVNNTKMAVVGNEPYRAVMTNAHAVADEFSKMFKGGSNSDAEIRSWEAGLSPNMTKAEWHGQIAKLTGLLGGTINALDASRTRGMATSQELPPLLSPNAADILDKAAKWSKGLPVQLERGVPAKTAQLPPQAASQLKEGIHTKFGNGQVWTLQNGQPIQVK